MSLVLSQAVFSKSLHINPNELSTLNLQDGDEIILDNMPFGWGISRIVLGLNSVPSIQLSGRIVVGNCVHSLHDYYEQVDFVYEGAPTIKYYGPPQKLPIQWWVDSSPVTSSCESIQGMSRKDSVVDKIYNVVDSIYHSRMTLYKDLGNLNTEYVFKGSSEHFKITSLPDWFFNQVYVQIEPLDGRQLNGVVYSGDNADVCTLNNLVNQSSGWLKIGYQCRPGSLIVVNGEPIRVGRSGIYEINNGTIID